MLTRAPFPIDKLFERPFSQRLRSLLDDARSVLRLRAVALVELAAEEGRVEPSWRCYVPWSRAPAALPLAVFEQLVAGAAVRCASLDDLITLGPPFDDCPAATLVALQLTPRLAAHPDALAILLHEREEPLEPEQLTALRDCLEHGLSHDRAQRLRDVVFRAVEQAADPIELTDSEARLLYANGAWERTFGYAAADAVGQTVGRLFRDPVAPVHDTGFYQFTLATLAGGKAWTGALACRARDGSRVFCEPMVSPFDARAQGFTGNIAIRRNLAHRAERDAALAIAHREFRTVLAALPDGAAVLRDGKIYFVNAALLHMLRRSESSAIGLDYADLLHPEDRALFCDAHEHTVMRVRMLRDDGSLRFVEISTAGAVSFEGKPAMILLSRDVTEQRVAEEQLARAERLSALGSLAAGVAHEINNPLAYVSLNLQYLLRATQLQGAPLDALRETIDGTKRIQQIVMELRGYARTDAPGPSEPVELEKVASSAINIAQNEIRHRARLERHLEPDLYVLGREGPLVQVLVNVLVNAAQAIPEPSPDGREHAITISARVESAGSVTVEIADTGVGIAPSQLAHVFEPFSTTKRRGEGSGLGLAITKRIVEELGGQITIRSCLGQGCTVRLVLPRASREPDSIDCALAVLDEATPAAVSGDKLRLLIVDDEATIASTLQRVLLQYDVSVALGARDALQLMAAGPRFDAVLCDLMMPGVPGRDFYREAVREHPPLRSRFVFMTGGAFTEDARAFLERTRCPVLAKPFTVADVCRMVEHVVRRPEPRQSENSSAKLSL